jgi:hypothetical protein
VVTARIAVLATALAMTTAAALPVAIDMPITKVLVITAVRSRMIVMIVRVIGNPAYRRMLIAVWSVAIGISVAGVWELRRPMDGDHSDLGEHRLRVFDPICSGCATSCRAEELAHVRLQHPLEHEHLVDGEDRLVLAFSMEIGDKFIGLFLDEPHLLAEKPAVDLDSPTTLQG